MFCIEEAFNMAKFWKTERHEDTTEKRQLLKDDIDFLVNLQREMNTQDHLSQADPRYWTIRDYRKIYGDNLNNPDGICIYDTNSCSVIFEGEFSTDNLDNIKEALKDFIEDDTDLEEKFNEIEEYSSLDDILEYIENYPEIYVYEYEEYPVDFGMFLTHEAAIQHLKLNDYHYSDKAHTYAQTAWRSREERLWNILQTVDWSKIQIKAE